MTWVLADGSKLTLAFHTPDEWAGKVRAHLRRLGCSEIHADHRVSMILTARKP